ncbi:hypothetical protein HNR46_003834 [Haloferula luteola]|uniref:Uncharacterized protein n=1 Tax=Haloferula luteola TaxID=595692 RepID=A0A840V794_9BACT|nr:hypothetical protein [Haloferula luteola]MBB5353573.1 hypothetical protein [Haloferula luteola]
MKNRPHGRLRWLMPAPLVACALTGGARAAFTEIDSFESRTLGDINGQGSWVAATTTANVVAEPGRAYNQVLHHTGAGDAGVPWPVTIPDTGSGTYFFRVRAVALNNDISIGATNVAPTTTTITNFANFQVQPNAVGSAFRGRDAATLSVVVPNMVVGAWYDVWTVIDNTTDSYRMFLQSDDDPAYATQTEYFPPDGTWNFRTASTTAILATQLTSNSGSTSVYIDDFYVDVTGSNLANPSPTLVDSDGDGMADAWEMHYFGDLSPTAISDSDSDGLTDLEEYQASTDPTLTDTDGDGLSDAEEVSGSLNDFFPPETDPLDADSDDDGLTDGQEVLGTLNTAFSNEPTDPNSEDTDYDGYLDADELTFGTDPNDGLAVPELHELVGLSKRNGSFETRSGVANATNYKLGWDGAAPDNIDNWTTWTEQTTTSTDSGVETGNVTHGSLKGFCQIGNGAKNLTPYLARAGDVLRLAYDRVNGYTTGDTFLVVDGTSLSLGYIALPGAPAQEDTSNGSYTLTYRIPEGSVAIGLPVGVGIRNNAAAASWPGWDSVVLSVQERDSDGDGLGDFWEDQYFGNADDNPTSIELALQTGSGDADSDGYTNQQEYLGGSDPADGSSVPADSDADGLDDAWEIDSFGSLEYGAEDDPDHDFATNAQEEAAGTLGSDAGDWPDSDGDGMGDAWELLHGLNVGVNDAALDADMDGSSNLAEHDAGSDPQDAGWTATRAQLKHRWSFNGSLEDSVGGSDAQIIEVGANDATLTATGVTLTGGAKGESDYVQLGSHLIGGSEIPVTIEIFATQHSVQNWGRIFDFGTDVGTTGAANNYLFMSWTVATDLNSDKVAWDPENGNESAISGTNAPYLLDVPYHIVLTINPAYNAGLLSGSEVTWWSAPLIGSQPNGHPLMGAKGSFITTLHLADLVDSVNLLGRSMWPDATANATYDEVRIWNGVLADDERETLHLVGADSTDRSDADGDGLPDAWEMAYFGNTTTATSAAGDPDHDSYTNLEELVDGSDPMDVNSTPLDRDADGLEDELFELAYFNNLLQNGDDDPDGDLIDNATEAEYFTDPTDANSSPDSDDDGLPDGWEMLNFGSLAQSGTGDFDNDGDSNLTEYQNGSDPTDPFSSSDSDGDGLPDGWERFYFGDLDELAAGDPDGDDSVNAAEYTAGTDPTDGNDVPDLNGDGEPDGHLLVGIDVLGTTSFNTGLHWDDSLAPVAGSNYMVYGAPGSTYGNGLRTVADGDSTFAGDLLALSRNGDVDATLVIKSSGVTTIPHLILDGALLNQAAAAVCTLTGTTWEVTRSSELWANNLGMTVNAPLSGVGPVNITGVNTVTLGGVNTLSGNYVLGSHTGTTGQTPTLALASTGSIRFAPGASGVSNAITGTGNVTLDGSFVLDLSGAATAEGSSWDLITSTGTLTVNASFSVSGFAADSAAVGSRVWTQGGYSYDESTGVLSVGSSADGDGDGMDDSWETTYFGGTSATGGGPTEDYDGDGTDNLTEYLLGLIPNDSSSRFAAWTSDANGSTGGFTLSWPSREGVTFRIERSTQLGSWVTVASGVPAATGGTVTSYTDAGAPTGKSFYRVVLE